MKPLVSKITRPALRKIAPRQRLFRRIDRLLRRHSVVWVSAPAGSGKTTLAASWLEARRCPCLWYQIDAVDADPATIFYYLRAAAGRLAPRRRETLPLLTPEYALGLEAYARHFFERLGARIPAGTVMVLDNYQDLPEEAPLQSLLAVALSALPEGMRVLVLSRSGPSPPFARLITEGAIGFLEAEELNLSAEETRALARARVGGRIAGAELEALRAQTGGWIAGTVLLLEAPVRALPAPRGAGSAAEQVLFDYFAAEIFDRAPEGTQRLLLATAVLPEVSAPAAKALAGEPRAAEILADLVARNYFTLRLAGNEPRYRYHPLFREFLLSRARRTFDEAGWRALAGRAADILAAAGNAEDAAALLAEAGALERLAGLVVASAPLLARQGRLASLESLIRALPAAMAEGDPWLTYWLGVCQGAELRQACAHFESAYRAFRARGDLTGVLLAWAGFVNSYLLAFDEFGSLAPWAADMEELCRTSMEELCRACPGLPSLEVEVQITSGMFATLFWREPTRARLEHWDRRAVALLESEAPPDLRMQLAVYPVVYRVFFGDYPGARQLIDRARPLLAARDVRPLTEINWYTIEADYQARIGGGAACLAAVERGLATAERTGVLGLNHPLAQSGVYGALAAGDLATARRYHARARETLGPGERLNRAHLLHLGAWIDLCAGDVLRAEEQARASLECVREVGIDMGRTWAEYTLAHVLVERGRHDEAAAFIERALAWSRGVESLFVEHDCLLALAYTRLSQGREPEALQWLRQALRLGREREFITHTWIGWRKDVMARLTALALEHGVEVKHVHDVIRARGLHPPEEAAALDGWPWPIRVRALGRFELRREGEIVEFGPRPPRKPLELLQAIVTLGADGISERELADYLWPEAEGDAGQSALETTLHRLRRVLGVQSAIVQSNRTIRLDKRCCWTDVRVLQRQLATGFTAPDHAPLEAATIRRQAERVLELYRGPLLPELETEWVSGARERLRAQVARYLRTAAQHLERAGQATAVEGLLSCAMDADRELRLFVRSIA